MGWLFAPFAVLLGVVLTTQVATNAQLGKALGNDYIPAAVNMAIGLVATAALTWSLTSEWPSREMVRAAPWYVWFAGGVMGTIYLTGNILLAPRLGAGELVGLVVAGQGGDERTVGGVHGGEQLRFGVDCHGWRGAHS